MVTNLLFSFLFLTSVFAAQSRVVTLTPALAEIVVDVMGGDQEIVGVTEFSDFPSSLTKKPSVGPYFKCNIEKIVSLKPTHIFASMDGNDKNQVERMKYFGLNVVVLKYDQVSDISDMYKKIGFHLSKAEVSERLIEQMNKRYSFYKKAKDEFQVRKKKRVVIQIGASPLVVVGGKGFLSELVDLSGVENVFKPTPKAYLKISREEVLLKKPDKVIFLSMSSSEKEIQEIRSEWMRLGVIVTVMRGDRILRPTSRVFDGLDDFIKAANE